MGGDEEKEELIKGIFPKGEVVPTEEVSVPEEVNQEGRMNSSSGPATEKQQAVICKTNAVSGDRLGRDKEVTSWNAAAKAFEQAAQSHLEHFQ